MSISWIIGRWAPATPCRGFPGGLILLEGCPKSQRDSLREEEPIFEFATCHPDGWSSAPISECFLLRCSKQEAKLLDVGILGFDGMRKTPQACAPRQRPIDSMGSDRLLT